MRIANLVFGTAIAVLAAGTAAAADNSVLIQTGPDGHYKLWHTEGATSLDDDEALALAASARPEGGAPRAVAAGTAQAFETAHGVVVAIPDAPADKSLLIDRDACGAVKIWHAEGSTVLTEDQMTELVMSALPAGGKPVNLGGRYAKAFVTPLGYTVVLWQPVVR